MGEQLGVTAKIDGKNPVARHWALQLFTDEAGAHQTFDGTPDGIKRIEFKDLKIKLEEPETDHFAFVLLDDPVKPGKDGENLELRIGTRRTGGRIVIASTVHRTEKFAGTDEELIDNYNFAAVLNPEEDGVRVASLSMPGTSNILKNNFDDERGRGYQLPPTVILKLDEKGTITIVPDYPQARRSKPQKLLKE